MSEKIPADIMKAAEEIVERIAKVHIWKGDCVSDVALAILNERKRYAEAYMHWARKMMEEVEGKGE